MTTGPNTSRWMISESWAGADDDRRLVEEAGPVDRPPADGHLGAGVARAVDEADDPLELVVGDDRSHRDVGVVRVAGLDAPRPRR